MGAVGSVVYTAECPKCRERCNTAPRPHRLLHDAIVGRGIDTRHFLECPACPSLHVGSEVDGQPHGGIDSRDCRPDACSVEVRVVLGGAALRKGGATIDGYNCSCRSGMRVLYTQEVQLPRGETDDTRGVGSGVSGAAATNHIDDHDLRPACLLNNVREVGIDLPCRADHVQPPGRLVRHPVDGDVNLVSARCRARAPERLGHREGVH